MELPENIGPTFDARMEWVLETSQKLTQNLICELNRNWDMMYEMTPEIANRRCDKFIKHLKDFYGDILSSEKCRGDALRSQIQQMVEEIKKLEQELDVKIEYNVPNGVPMTTVIKQLSNSMEEYEEVRASRIKSLKNLRAKEKALCEELTMPMSEPVPEVPSEEQLENIQLHVFTLEEEKLKRVDKYINTKKRFKEILQEMGLIPETEFATEVVHSCENTFKITAENMDRLQELLESYEERYNQAVNERHVLINNLKSIWKKIRNPENESRQFLDTHQGISVPIINKIKEEIKRCDAIKLANIKNVIIVAKQELEEIWDKLTYTEEQRKQFLPYCSELYTEDVLNLHELEIASLNKHYEDNIQIYELAKKRDDLWAKMIHLEELAQDKTRLFNNRGGQLLKEEKERKSIETNLPKIDKQLQQLLNVYLSVYRKPFMWYGHNLLTKIDSDWKEYEHNKEMKKMQRKKEHSKELQIEAMLGTQVGTKRKLPLTPKMNADEIEETALGMKKITDSPLGRRAALRDLNNVGSVMCSSPSNSPPSQKLVSTPKSMYIAGSRTPKGARPKTPTSRMLTPRRPTPARPRTPATTPKRNLSPPRLTPARSRFNLNI